MGSLGAQPGSRVGNFLQKSETVGQGHEPERTAQDTVEKDVIGLVFGVHDPVNRLA